MRDILGLLQHQVAACVNYRQGRKKAVIQILDTCSLLWMPSTGPEHKIKTVNSQNPRYSPNLLTMVDTALAMEMVSVPRLSLSLPSLVHIPT